MRSSLTRRSWI
jgi:hypothetical protein